MQKRRFFSLVFFFLLFARAVYSQSVITNLNGDSVSFTEGGAAVLIDNGSNATITNDGAGYDTGNLTVTITSANSSDDLIINTGVDIVLSTGMTEGSTVTVSETLIGTIAAGGTGQDGDDLVVTLNTNANDELLATLIHNLSYSNSSDDPPASRTLTLTVTNANSATSTNSDITVSITSVNDAPSLTATGEDPTFTEYGSAADIYSSINISAVEVGQTITEIVLTVTNVFNGSDEIMSIDGSDVALTNGNSVTTLANSMTVNVSLSGNTATVTVSKIAGIASAAMQTLIDGMNYRNENDTPDTSDRVITLTSIKDNGGTENGGADTTVLNIGSTVTVVAADNEPPLLTVTPNDPTFTEGDPAVDLFSGVSFSAPEAAQKIIELVFRINNVENDMNEILSIDGSDVGLGNGDSVITANNSMRVMVSYKDTTSVWRYVTITDTLTTTVGYPASIFQDVIENMTYRNVSSAIRTSTRKIVIFFAKDDGGTTDGGIDSVTYIDSTTVTIIGVNDRPNLDDSKSPVLNGVPENINDPANGQTLYSTLVSKIIQKSGSTGSSIENYSDPDNDPPGLAIIGVNAQGTVWYSLDNGTNWNELTGVVSETSALALYADDDTRIYYKPDNGISGTVNDALTIKAWDRTAGGVNGTTAVNTTLGNAFSTATDNVEIEIADINYPPNLSATGLDPTFTEGGAAVDLFSTVNAETPEPGQLLLELSLTVENILNGSDEILLIDGTQVQLINGNSVITSTNSMTVEVSVFGSNATIVISKVGGVSEALIETIVDGITYENLSNSPGSSSRKVTLTSLKDDGGAANGSDTGTYAITSIISIHSINEPPVITNLNGDNSTVVAGGISANVDVNGDASVTNPDTPISNGGSILIVQSSGTQNGTWSFDGTVVKSGADGIISASEEVYVNSIKIGTISSSNTGAAGDTLLVLLEENSSTSAITYLLKNLKYSAPADVGNRNFTLTLDDGEGSLYGGDSDVSISLTITVTQNPPVISGLNGDRIEYQRGSGPIVLDVGSNASVTDPDSPNFDTGNLTVSISTGLAPAEDEIVINTAGSVSLSAGMTNGSNVSVDAVLVGSISQNGKNGSDLVITFNANSTHARISTLLQAISYNNLNASSPSIITRIIDFRIRDASGVGSALSNVESVQVILNRAPTTIGIADVEVLTNANNTVIDLTISFDDADEGSDALNYTLESISNPAIFTSLFISGTSLVIDYGLGTSGTSFITIRATDSGGLYVETTFNVKVETVSPVSDNPVVIVNNRGQVDEGGTLTITQELFSAEDSQGNTATLVYQISQMPAHGSLVLSSQLYKSSIIQTFIFTHDDLIKGNVSYIHDGSETSSDSFEISITDEQKHTSTVSEFLITIIGVNDPPVIGRIAPINMQEDVPYLLNITDWYNVIDDPDNIDSTLSISVYCNNENITLSTSNNKNYTITTAENYFGSTFLSVLLSDGELSCGTDVPLMINAVNDAPVINNLPSQLTITSGMISFFDLCNCISDIETPDSLLILSFEVEPDSVYTNYRASIGKLTLWPNDSFYGSADLTITVFDQDGSSASATILLNIVQVPTEIEKLNEIPDEFILYQNYPNPFNSSTTIRYGLPMESNVEIVIYNMLGQRVFELINRIQNAGYHEVLWDAVNITSGVYFYVITSQAVNGGDLIQLVKKFILIK